MRKKSNLKDTIKNILPDQTKSENVKGNLQTTKEALTLAKDNMELAEKLKITESLGRTAHFLHVVGEVFPPVRLVVLAITNLWDIVHTTFHEEGKPLSRSARIGLSIGGIAAGVIAFTIPAVAGAMLIAGMGITLAKDGVKIVDQITGYLRSRSVLQKAKTELATLQSKNNNVSPEHLAELQQRVVEAEKQLVTQRSQLTHAAINAFWSSVAVVGAVMMITPLFPVGLGLLIGSGVGGLASHYAPTLFNKLVNFFTSKKTEAGTETNPVSAIDDRQDANSEQAVQDDKTKLQDATALVSVMLAENHHTHDRGSHSDESFSSDAIQEAKASLQHAISNADTDNTVEEADTETNEISGFEKTQGTEAEVDLVALMKTLDKLEEHIEESGRLINEYPDPQQGDEVEGDMPRERI
jgi:hypothetical protein